MMMMMMMRMMMMMIMMRTMMTTRTAKLLCLCLCCYFYFLYITLTIMIGFACQFFSKSQPLHAGFPSIRLERPSYWYIIMNHFSHSASKNTSSSGPRNLDFLCCCCLPMISSCARKKHCSGTASIPMGSSGQ